jgi:hypothetical protein
MKCINCGAGLEGHVNGTIVKCSYCGSSCAFLESSQYNDVKDKDLTSDEQRALSAALLEFSCGEYKRAKKILEIFDDSHRPKWEILILIAQVDFYLGYDDFTHLPSVLRNVQRAMACCPSHNEIHPIVVALSYNIVRVCALNNRHGQALLNCIHAIESAKALVQGHTERDAIVEDFIKANATTLKEQFFSSIKREKRNYVPTKGFIEAIVKLASLSPSTDMELTKIGLLVFNMRRNDLGSHDYANKVQIMTDCYYASTKNKDLPKLRFSLFGSVELN